MVSSKAQPPNYFTLASSVADHDLGDLAFQVLLLFTNKQAASSTSEYLIL
jgi:hypothetical protein